MAELSLNLLYSKFLSRLFVDISFNPLKPFMLARKLGSQLRNVFFTIYFAFFKLLNCLRLAMAYTLLIESDTT